MPALVLSFLSFRIQSFNANFAGERTCRWLSLLSPSSHVPYEVCAQSNELKIARNLLVAVQNISAAKPAKMNRLDIKVSPEAQKPSSEASQDFTENFIAFHFRRAVASTDGNLPYPTLSASITCPEIST